MAELKTKPTRASVAGFLKAIPDESRRKDCRALAKMMQEETGSRPKMWGPSIVGFGSYHYKYASGREGDWFLAGFSPRKQDLTLYIMSGLKKHEELLSRLGKHKGSKSCLYIKRMEDVDPKVLRKLVSASVQHLRKTSG